MALFLEAVLLPREVERAYADHAVLLPSPRGLSSSFPAVRAARRFTRTWKSCFFFAHGRRRAPFSPDRPTFPFHAGIYLLFGPHTSHTPSRSPLEHDTKPFGSAIHRIFSLIALHSFLSDGSSREPFVNSPPFLRPSFN